VLGQPARRNPRVVLGPAQRHADCLSLPAHREPFTGGLHQNAVAPSNKIVSLHVDARANGVGVGRDAEYVGERAGDGVLLEGHGAKRHAELVRHALPHREVGVQRRSVRFPKGDVAGLANAVNEDDDALLALRVRRLLDGLDLRGVKRQVVAGGEILAVKRDAAVQRGIQNALHGIFEALAHVNAVAVPIGPGIHVKTVHVVEVGLVGIPVLDGVLVHAHGTDGENDNNRVSPGTGFSNTHADFRAALHVVLFHRIHGNEVESGVPEPARRGHEITLAHRAQVIDPVHAIFRKPTSGDKRSLRFPATNDFHYESSLKKNRLNAKRTVRQRQTCLSSFLITC